MVVHLALLGIEHSYTPGKVRAARQNPAVRLLGVYEADPQVRAERAAQEAFADLHWFARQEELLAAPGLQGVIIDGYARHNVALAQAALQAGKSILLEKPAGSRGLFPARRFGHTDGDRQL
jgi:predicted dehydrogenase